MSYFYDICPWCMDELTERDQLAEGGYSDKFCPKCGRKLEKALYGIQRIDDTRYKIILEDAAIREYGNRRNRFIEILMKMGNINYDEAMKRYNTANSVIFEGDAREAYIYLYLIHPFTDQMHYRVVPEFPFLSVATPFTCICHTCGSYVVEKKGGTFCEKCNKWILLPPL